MPEPFKLISGVILLAGAAVLEIRVIAVVLFWGRHGAASCKPVNYTGALGRWNFQHRRQAERDARETQLSKNSIGFHFN